MAETDTAFDTIVVGLGGMGSAALFHLAARGRRVLGLERYTAPHEMGSSHGVTRIIRLAYYEHPSYVPLLRRSYTLWHELERESGEQLLYITGSIDAGPPDSRVFEGSLRSCQEHGLAHEVLSSAALSERFPGYRLPSDTMALYQPDGGFLLPERCIAAHIEAARRRGAQIQQEERVLGWEASTSGVLVHTDRGRYRADHLVLTAGAWTGKLAPDLAPLAVPERQALAWFQTTRPDLFTPERFPVFNIQVSEGRYYGLPVFGVPGFKVGRYHHREEIVDPDTLDRVGHAEDERVLREFAARYFPDGSGQTLGLKVCMFVNSPDEHFLIDRHPQHPQVVVAGGFSGHGYKFCSVVGEILADLATEQGTRHDVSLFRLSRFPGSSPEPRSGVSGGGQD